LAENVKYEPSEVLGKDVLGEPSSNANVAGASTDSAVGSVAGVIDSGQQITPNTTFGPPQDDLSAHDLLDLVIKPDDADGLNVSFLDFLSSSGSQISNTINQ
jgi:hypothetical protein